MKRTLIALAFVAAAFVSSTAVARPPAPVAPAPIAHVNQWDAIIKCKGMAEDTAAHVRLVQYSHPAGSEPVIVYHCKHLGY